MQKLYEFFGIKKGITALIGGGGKTSTMYALAEELCAVGSVILCTSTHIRKPEQYPYLSLIPAKLPFGCVVSTGLFDGNKLSAPIQSFSELSALADYVLVEADGSRQLPLKAHATHEPVIPEGTDKVLAVIGIDGLGQTIRKAAHRPELYAEIAHTDVNEPVTMQMIHEVVQTYPKYDGIVINKADDPEQIEKAEALASLFAVPVAITAWKTQNPIKSFRRNSK